MSKSNKARGIERKITGIAKNATEAWEKLQNPNCFGGGPVTDPQGKLISLNITAFGNLAKFFEEPDIQARLREAIRKNNLEFSGYKEEVSGVRTSTTTHSNFPLEVLQPAVLSFNSDQVLVNL